jgi:hypothetical protein
MLDQSTARLSAWGNYMCIKCNCNVLYSCTAPLLKTGAKCNLAVGDVETPVVYTMSKPIPMMLHMSLIVGIVRMRLPVVCTIETRRSQFLSCR